MKRSLTFYVLVALIFGSLMWYVFDQGAKLEPAQQSQASAAEGQEERDPVSQEAGDENPGASEVSGGSVSRIILDPLSLLLLQIATIVIVSRVLAFLFSKIGQPLVIGEIIGGILLGPSLLGLVWPSLSNFLFQPQSMANLQILSQLGLVLFMFVVGLELDAKQLKSKAHSAVVVSHASIIFPFLLGVGLAYYLYRALAPAQITFLAFGLFMGIAMSITAFPVLARIIHERGLAGSPLGTLAITCAAADDVTAWCILAAVIAIVQAGSLTSAVTTVLITGVYVLVMLKLVRPFLRGYAAKRGSASSLDKTFTVIALTILFLSALTTEQIGIHALFGAFLAGVIMPAQFEIRKILAGKLEDISTVVLLPLFFAFTGLKTQIGLLNNGVAWFICGLIILVAIVGKFGGALVAAKVTGQTWSDSFAIGALMNTRGLMELIVLNIGYDLGVLPPTVFTMMVLMALVTTFMTSPVLSLINHLNSRRITLGAKALPEQA